MIGEEHRLIVYGSLVPGGPNHAELAEIEGTWSRGYVTGKLVQLGWGADIGYPALIWEADGERVPAHLLESSELPEHWQRLDHFEGDAYRRRPVPFHREGGAIVVGQIYVLRGSA